LEKAMNYYQFHIGDYTSHTRHLSPIEDIAYRRLLDLYYLHERPLNSGSASVARQINMREFEDEVKLILEEFFTLSDDGWINVRADKEIAHYRGKIEQASRAGKASAERRFNTCSTDVQLTNNHKPITNNQEYIDRFDIFWKQYPRKVAKPNALKSWLKIKPDDVVLKKMLDAINQQGLPSKEIQFVPHPASWLNANRWEDEITAPTTNVMNMGRRIL
jgi:uncharacterized protein YdaU (DUF1376 family)